MDELLKYAPLANFFTTIIVTLVAVVGVVRYLNGRFTRIENRLDRIEARMDRMEEGLHTLNSWAAGFSREVNSFFGVIVQLLSNRRELSSEELGLVTKSLTALGEPAAQTLFDRERISRNPLTAEELARLEGYYARLRRGEMVSPTEADDYNRLVAVLQKDHPSDPGIWPLVALGAFLLGLMMGRTDREG